MLRSSLFAAACLSLAVSSPLLAQEASEETGILTLEMPGEASVTEFDLAALKEMPVTEIETSTVWTDGVTQFAGVALSDLLADLDDEGAVIHATARDGYSVEIPATDAVPGGPIVAYEMNGEPLEADMMGPYWIIYPYDSSEAYQTEEIEARSIWQLARLTLGN